jgi:putative transposase
MFTLREVSNLPEGECKFHGGGMPKRGDVFIKGYYYHIYNRVVDGLKLFYNPDNFEYCLKLVKRYSKRYCVGVIAYCLMPNHYHFLLQQQSEIPLSLFIGSVFNAYVQAVNKHQKRKGTIFESRFKYVLIDNENYIVHLCRYIHLNPSNAGLVQRPEDWPFSNHLEWVNRRSGTLKDDAFIKERFSQPQDYERFVNDFSHLGVSSLIKNYILE